MFKKAHTLCDDIDAFMLPAKPSCFGT